MPDLVTTLKALAWIATFAAMFGGAARLGSGCLRDVRERRPLFVRTIVAVWVVVPLFTIAMVLAFRVRRAPATILLVMAVCPGLPQLLGNTKSVRGSLSTALLALVLTALTEPLLIPVWTALMTAFHYLDLRIDAVHVLAVLVPTVYLPVLLGFLTRARWPRAATALARAGDTVYWVGLVGGAIVALIQGSALLRHVPARAYLAVVVITVGDALIGFWVARPDPDDQKAISLATALGNPALAITVVEASYPDHDAGALVAAYIIIRAVTITPFELWLARWRSSRPVRPAVRRQERPAS